MEHPELRNMPQGLKKLNGMLLTEAMDHFMHFAKDESLVKLYDTATKMLSETAENSEEALYWNARCIELEENYNKPITFPYTKEGNRQFAKVREHYRDCMIQLLAHYALSIAWNDRPTGETTSPVSAGVRKQAIGYLQSSQGERGGQLLCKEFNKTHVPNEDIIIPYKDIHRAATRLLSSKRLSGIDD